jgi:hypothetical protein
MERSRLGETSKFGRTGASVVADRTLADLFNINSKFTGTGGMSSSLAVKPFVSQPKVKSTGIFRPCPVIESTLFKKYYDRGDLPVAVSFTGAVRKVFGHFMLNIIRFATHS